MSYLFGALASALLACPATIEDRQVLDPPIEGWETQVKKRLQQLEYAHIFWKKPAGMPEATLIPEITSTGFVWTEMGDSTWVSCEYSATKIRLVRKLPKGARCVFTKSDPWKGIEASFVCTKA